MQHLTGLVQRFGQLSFTSSEPKKPEVSSVAQEGKLGLPSSDAIRTPSVLPISPVGAGGAKPVKEVEKEVEGVAIAIQKVVTPSKCELSKLNPRLWDDTLPGNVRLKIASLLDAPLCRAFDITCIVHELLGEIQSDMRAFDDKTRAAVEVAAPKVHSLNLATYFSRFYQHSSDSADPLILRDICYRFPNCTSFVVQSDFSSLQELQRLSKLRKLTLKTMHVHFKSPPGLRLKNLQELHLILKKHPRSSTEATLNSGCIEDLLPACPNVTTFRLKNEDAVRAVPPFVGKKGQLTHLELDAEVMGSEEEWSAFIDAQTSLTSLNIQHCNMTEKTFSYLCQKMKLLQTLTLGISDSVSGACLSKSCAQLQHLRSLTLQFRWADTLSKDPKPLSDLFSLPTLRKLSIQLKYTPDFSCVDFEKPVDLEALAIPALTFPTSDAAAFKQSRIEQVTLLDCCHKEYIDLCSSVKDLAVLFLDLRLYPFTKDFLMPLAKTQTLKHVYITIPLSDKEIMQQATIEFRKLRPDIQFWFKIRDNK